MAGKEPAAKKARKRGASPPEGGSAAAKKQCPGPAIWSPRRPTKTLRLTTLGMDTRQLREQQQTPTISTALLTPGGIQEWTCFLDEDHWVQFSTMPESASVRFLPVDKRLWAPHARDPNNHAAFLANLKRDADTHIFKIGNMYHEIPVLINGKAIPTKNFHDKFVVESGDEITVFDTTFLVEYW